MAQSPSGPAPGRGGRRALGPGLTAFLVVDVILVLTLVVLAAMALSDRDPGDDAAPEPTASSEPESTPDQSAPQDAAESSQVEAFVLPSGNIHCEMTADSATCTILDFSYPRPEATDDCDGTVGNVLTVTAEDEAMSFPCTEGDPPEPADDLPVLDYGEASTIGEMTCQSSRNGAFCRHNPSGAGFSVARAGYTEFSA